MSNIYYDGMHAPKGGKYSKPNSLPKPDPPQKYDKKGKKIRTKLPGGLHSYYLLPIQITPGRASGNSRRHGDASPEVQNKAINAIIEATKNHRLTHRETAHVLAIAFVESGFNPDAAAGTTTAASLGQFVRGTGWGYGLNDTNRFELKSNADALVRHYIKNRDKAIERGNTGKDIEIKIYVYHHDGSGKVDINNPNSLGLKISKEQVIPYTDKIERMLNGEKAVLKPQKQKRNRTPKNSQTMVQQPTPTTPRWSNPNQKAQSSVRNPTPPANYHNTRNSTATQTMAGKPPICNQPKSSGSYGPKILRQYHDWLYDKLCVDD